MEEGSLDKPDAWAEEAARLPLAFSQVREDPAVDAAVLQRLGFGVRILMIASGGDTAAWLCASGRASRLVLVDINPAQLALCRFKLHLLRHHQPADRLALLGHARAEPSERRFRLAQILEALDFPETVFGPPELVSDWGPDHAGRYERLFAQLRAELNPHREELETLFRLGDPAEQHRRAASSTLLGQAIEAALASVMRLPNLIRLFGAEATGNARTTFARHFAERTQAALSTFPARENPFLAQLLLGRFLPGAHYLWLEAAPPHAWPQVIYKHSTALHALASTPAESLDMIHLSNVLDWLSPAAAAETLGCAWRALRPGGAVIIRQLNSTLDIPAAAPGFHWRREESETLHAHDRSFFYRALFIAEKKAGL